MIPPSTPVIVGVGQFTERLEAPDYRGLSNVELAAESARRACVDAKSLQELTAHIDAIGALRTFEDSTPRYATPFGKSNNFPQSIARRLGVTPKTAVWASVGGDTPQTLISEFCEKIASGAVRMALVVGAEAISTARHLLAEKKTADWTETVDAPVDDRGPALHGLSTHYNRQHRILAAADSYAILENARRRRLGLTRAAYAREMGELFALFSAVAARNPYSTAPVEHTAEELVTVTQSNRMIADPYPRLLVSRDQVNQSAAVLIASVAVARELGIDERKWVYLHGYSKVAEREILSREDLGTSQAARLAARAALAAAQITVDDVAYFDLYSCFPVPVFNICEGLGISPQDPRGLTVTGGLPYFGGPGNSYSTHAVATMVEKLRAHPGSFGFIGANGGHMSKYAVGIYSTRPVEFRRCDSSAVQAQVDALPVPAIAFDADGAATIESYTIVYGKTAPSHAIVVGRLSETGGRFLANTHDGDAATLQEMVDTDPLGRSIFVRSLNAGNRFAFSREHLDQLFPRRPPAFQDRYEFVLAERRGHVLEVTLNRPESRNSLHPPANEELDAIFDAFFADADLWVAIVSGAGESFCAGNDLKFSASKPVYLPKNGFGGLTARANRTKPVIAAVNGYAIGGGLEICLACELVVADTTAQLGLSEVRVGLIPGAGGLIRLPRRIPQLVANEMILTGRRIGAEEAKSLGLVNRVVPAGQALQGARALAEEILESSPTSVRIALQIMRDTQSLPDELAATRWRHPALDELLLSEDALEGQVAFAQKRKPRWKNR